MGKKKELKTGDKVKMKGYKGKILSTKHDPIFLVDFGKPRRPLGVHKKDLE